MKRITSLMLAILMLSSTFAYSEGLLPSLTDTFGVDMPSMAVFLEREPDEETTDETGTVTQVFNQVSENDFDGFNKYLEENGCALASYLVNDSKVTETVERQSKTFTFLYDNAALLAVLNYPADTNPDKYVPIPNEIFISSDGPEQIFDSHGFSSSVIQKYDIHYKRSTEMEIGEYVRFGRYEQDNNLENGPEEIIWRILDIQDGKALLFSSTALEYLQFEEKAETATWDKCSLRRWLNEEFYRSAFDETERTSIQESSLSNPSNPKYGAYSGPDTKDSIFLLSSDEFEKYYDIRSCVEGDRTESLLSKQGSDQILDYFWLRTVGAGPNSASVISVNLSGWRVWMNGIINSGEDINSFASVSPAVWVDLRCNTLKSIDDFLYLNFGAFEQDTNTDNGKEPVEWIVLNQQDNKVFLVSRYALEYLPYNPSNRPANNYSWEFGDPPKDIANLDFTWEASYPRKWLNEEFLEEAFTPIEQERISTFIGTQSNAVAQDRIVLLSKDEVSRYFPSDKERICLSTAQCRRGLNDYYKKVDWCLRSPDDNSNYIGLVERTGNVRDHAYIYSKTAIRPAMWVTLDD